MVAQADRPTMRRESAMNHINLDAQGEVVKRFFLTLPVDPDGSIIELNGHVVARVLPPEAESNGAGDDAGPWTEENNARRSDLIDKDIDAKLTPAEARELESLQRQMLRHRHRVAPLPLDDARRLHQELLAKVESARRK